MEKELKDYLNLYLGCSVETIDGTGKLIGIIKDEAFVDYRGYNNKGSTDEFGNEYDFVLVENEYFIKDVKPILRPLSDMTKEEKQNDLNIATIYTRDQAERIKYFLSKYFDIFGLIEVGLAIDKTTLKLNSPND